MISCDNCGYEDTLAEGRWNYKEQGETIDPPIVVVECPDCDQIVETRVDL